MIGVENHTDFRPINHLDHHVISKNGIEGGLVKGMPIFFILGPQAQRLGHYP